MPSPRKDRKKMDSHVTSRALAEIAKMRPGTEFTVADMAENINAVNTSVSSALRRLVGLGAPIERKHRGQYRRVDGAVDASMAGSHVSPELVRAMGLTPGLGGNQPGPAAEPARDVEFWASVEPAKPQSRWTPEQQRRMASLHPGVAETLARMQEEGGDEYVPHDQEPDYVVPVSGITGRDDFGGDYRIVVERPGMILIENRAGDIFEAVPLRQHRDD